MVHESKSTKTYGTISYYHICSKYTDANLLRLGF